MFCGLTFDMSGGLTDAKRRARRPLDGRVRRHWHLHLDLEAKLDFRGRLSAT